MLEYSSPVTLGFFSVSVLLLVLNAFPGYSHLMSKYFYCPPWSHFYPRHPLSYLRLVSHICGHQDYIHLFHNFKMILLLSPSIESHYGSHSFALLLLCAGFVTGLVHVSFASPGVALTGSSGVVFAVVGIHASQHLFGHHGRTGEEGRGGGGNRSSAASFFLSFFLNAKNCERTINDLTTIEVPISFILTLGSFLGEECVLAYSSPDNVSRLTHIVGTFVGVAFVKFAEERRKRKENVEYLIKIKSKLFGGIFSSKRDN